MSDEARRYFLVPPWTAEQVATLNRFQVSSGMHPFTCGKDSAHVLEATVDGWVCPTGDGYTQGWAHHFMAEPGAWTRSPVRIYDAHGGGHTAPALPPSPYYEVKGPWPGSVPGGARGEDRP